MGNYDGNALSPSKDKEIIIEKDVLSAKLILKKGPSKQVLLQYKALWLWPKINISELVWLNENQLVIVNGLKIGIYDIPTKRYAFLTDGFMPVTPVSENKTIK